MDCWRLDRSCHLHLHLHLHLRLSDLRLDRGLLEARSQVMVFIFDCQMSNQAGSNVAGGSITVNYLRHRMANGKSKAVFCCWRPIGCCRRLDRSCHLHLHLHLRLSDVIPGSIRCCRRLDRTSRMSTRIDRMRWRSYRSLSA